MHSAPGVPHLVPELNTVPCDDPSLVPGMNCEADGECGTNDLLDNCVGGYDMYQVWKQGPATPPAPPPPPPACNEVVEFQEDFLPASVLFVQPSIGNNDPWGTMVGATLPNGNPDTDRCCSTAFQRRQ